MSTSVRHRLKACALGRVGEDSIDVPSDGSWKDSNSDLKHLKEGGLFVPSVLYCTVLYCTVLYCTVLYCTVLYCTVLYCTVLYYTVLYYTILYNTVLYCTDTYFLLFLSYSRYFIVTVYRTIFDRLFEWILDCSSRIITVLIFTPACISYIYFTHDLSLCESNMLKDVFYVYEWVRVCVFVRVCVLKSRNIHGFTYLLHRRKQILICYFNFILGRNSTSTHSITLSDIFVLFSLLLFYYPLLTAVCLSDPWCTDFTDNAVILHSTLNDGNGHGTSHANESGAGTGTVHSEEEEWGNSPIAEYDFSHNNLE